MLKDWKKVTGGWKHKKKDIKLSIEIEEWEQFEKPYYRINIVENNKLRWYDNAFTNRGDALKSVKSYMRKH